MLEVVVGDDTIVLGLMDTVCSILIGSILEAPSKRIKLIMFMRIDFKIEHYLILFMDPSAQYVCQNVLHSRARKRITL